MFQIIAVVLIVSSSAWVLLDTGQLGARRGALGGGLLDMGQVGWFVCCLLLWIVAFPAYLVARPRLIRARSARAALWSANFGGVGHAAKPPAVSNGVAATAGVAVVAAVVGLLGVQFWHDDARPSVAGSPAPTPVGAQRTTVTGPPSLAAQLTSIALRSTDFRAGVVRVALAPDGDQVRGQVTLDNCGHRFVTESARVARRQVNLLDAHGRLTGASNEVVAYRDSRQAAAALAEWYRTAAHCPRRAVSSRVTTTPRMRSLVTVNQQNLADVPSRANVLTVETLSTVGKHRRTMHVVVLMQVRGRFLDAVYALQSTTPNARDMTAVRDLAAITGARLMTV